MSKARIRTLKCEFLAVMGQLPSRGELRRLRRNHGRPTAQRYAY